MIQGNNIFISLDGSRTPFACTQSNSIKSGCKAIEISSPDSGEWEELLAGRKSWGMNVKSLVGAEDDIANLLMAGNTYTISVFSGRSQYIPKLIGRALCETVNIEAQRGNVSYGTFNFKGSGPLAPYTLATGLTLSASSLAIRVNASGQLTATLAPSSASIKKLFWETSNPRVAQVGQNGVIQAYIPGTAVITCRTMDGSNLSATCNVTVSQ